ncbi:MAG: hypothetical protein RIR52_414 [Acidobacteriota bacterium]
MNWLKLKCQQSLTLQKSRNTPDTSAEISAGQGGISVGASGHVLGTGQSHFPASQIRRGVASGTVSLARPNGLLLASPKDAKPHWKVLSIYSAIPLSKFHVQDMMVRFFLDLEWHLGYLPSILCVERLIEIVVDSILLLRKACIDSLLPGQGLLSRQQAQTRTSGDTR